MFPPTNGIVIPWKGRHREESMRGCGSRRGKQQALRRQDRQRQESGETPTSAATELTHFSPDGNSNTSSCLTQSPLSTYSCVASPPESLAGLHQRHATLFMELPQPHPSLEVPVFIPLQDFESSQGRGQAQHSPTAHMGHEGWEWRMRSPLQSHGSNISCGTRARGRPGIEGPDAGTWAQETVG